MAFVSRCKSGLKPCAQEYASTLMGIAHFLMTPYARMATYGRGYDIVTKITSNDSISTWLAANLASKHIVNPHLQQRLFEVAEAFYSCNEGRMALDVNPTACKWLVRVCCKYLRP